jgi:hypothetical protein
MAKKSKHKHAPACIVVRGKSMACLSEAEGLHERIAKALKWSISDTRSFSLATLRDLVRPVSAKIAHDITTFLNN